MIELQRLFHDVVDQLRFDFFFREQLFHQGVRIHRQRFQERGAFFFRFFRQVSGDFLIAELFAVVAVKIDGFHAD